MSLDRFPAAIFVLSFPGVALSLWQSRSFELVAIRQAVITTYFPVTLLAKITLAIALIRLQPDRLTPWLPWVMLVIAVVVLGLAVSSVIVRGFLDDPSVVHNLTQWHGTTAFAAWYLLLARAWRQTGFGLRLVRRSDDQTLSP